MYESKDPDLVVIASNKPHMTYLYLYIVIIVIYMNINKPT